MRRALALLVPLLLVAPLAEAAAREETVRYVVDGGSTMRTHTLPGGERVGVNGASFFPLPGEARVDLRVHDLSGLAVAVGVCHEWTYDDGRHPTVECLARQCAPLLDVALRPPPEGATYRLLVFLFDEPWGCAAPATAGEVAAAFRT